MEPAFYRGDLLFLTNPANQRYQTGDITVYKIPGADIPIVHRVLETHDTKPKQSSKTASVSAVPLSRQRLLTKGDNNYVDDIELYKGLEWLERKHIVGKVRGYVLFIQSYSCPQYLIISCPQILALCWICNHCHGEREQFGSLRIYTNHPPSRMTSPN